MCGDFNVILSQEERNLPGGCLNNRRLFRRFVNRHSLTDLPLAGGRFTWTNSQHPPLIERLDRFLMSADWETHCPNLVQFKLKRPIYDHSPIMLSCNSDDKSKSPFRFDNLVLISWKIWKFGGTTSLLMASRVSYLRRSYKV